jgi:hypothetical protein
MGTDSCGPCVNKGRPKDQWTCHCNRGYYDFTLQSFIPGGRVSKGEARSREDYDAHLETCNQCHAMKEEKLRRDRRNDSAAIPPPPKSHYFLPGEVAEQEVVEQNVALLLCSDASVEPVRNLVCIQSRYF